MNVPISDTDHLVPFDGSFRVKNTPTRVGDPNDDRFKKKLKNYVEDIAELQRKLYAEDRYAVLLVFQAMDAAGKDSTIRAVCSGVNPAGFQVSSFKAPSYRELDHDFLWRTTLRLPQRGRIGVFNRSYYEETLVVRVHPEYLEGQRLPHGAVTADIWEQRFESIRDHERHLARNGTIILKFWLNVSYAEQRKRFVSRIDEPRKNWKFSSGDIVERGFWDQYMSAYQDALNATSRPWAPWFAIPADDKPYMRMKVARIVRNTLREMDLKYPRLAPADIAQLGEFKQQLLSESDD